MTDVTFAQLIFAPEFGAILRGAMGDSSHDPLCAPDPSETSEELEQ